jgi:hypothetical protein
MMSDALLSSNNAGQYALARARLRRTRFISPIIPQMQRLGDNGEWLHVGVGILWPWDNAILPSTIFVNGQ